MPILLFLDESGDHNLSIIDPQYPVFVLGGIVLESGYAAIELTESLDRFKREIFGDSCLVLHTADIVRNRNGFERLKDRSFRQNFLLKLNSIMRDLNYSVIACAIRKDDHLARYGLAALDPYLLSLDVVVERFCRIIGDVPDGGIIIAEKRNSALDRQLDLAWLNLKIQGTRHFQAKDIEKRVSSLNLRSKSDNIAGLQLADLVVSPIGRHFLRKADKEDWTIVKSKSHRNRSGTIDGYVTIPK